MDREKIGAFIAACRRDRGITQEQLAEALQVTGKAVSKWETGACLPEARLYEPLCEHLGIRIGELFAGCRQPDAGRALSRMLAYRLYLCSDRSLPFPEFDNALTRISEVNLQLRAFASKEDAVAFLMEETACPRAECEAAYDFYTKLFQEELP